MPAISVIIPVYNASATLRQCVDSLLTQEYKDFELILVDDGSTDKSLSICQDYTTKDRRVKVLHQDNLGVSAARNLGIQHSAGVWVTFVDSDDYVEPTFLSGFSIPTADLIIVGMKSFRFSSLSLYTIYGYPSTVILEGNALRSYLKQYVSDLLFRSPCAKFYKKTLMSDIHFHEDMKIAEDSCFVLDYLSRVSCISCVNNGSYVIRLSPIPAKSKYALSVENAIKSLQHLHDSYRKLDSVFQIGHYGFYSFIGYFKEISQNDWKSNPNKWYHNESVKLFYDYIWKELSLRQKVRIVAARFLKK